MDTLRDAGMYVLSNSLPLCNPITELAITDTKSDHIKRYHAKDAYDQRSDNYYHHHHDQDFDSGLSDRQHHSLLYQIDKSMWHLPCFLLTMGTIGCALFAYQAYERYEQQRRRGATPARRNTFPL
ncbi:unnamed protein product [Gongylonema pulchrum]|uniref:Deltameth_res domain-containing protein n=1 Tax=Gongylonema pulchrum TaxID=637853 RepID=A0A183D3G5_9BILA|nr:unnamed protein product [Gongylonema pulchrum]